MKPTYQRRYQTIGGKALAALALMSIIPYLLFVYLYVTGAMTVSETIVLYIPVILMSTVIGYFLIRRSADNVFYLSREIGRAHV